MSEVSQQTRDALARWYGAGDYNTALAALRDRVADGTFVSQLAREIKVKADAEGLTIGVSRPAISKLLNETDESARLLLTARADGAHALVEKALEVVMDVPNERDAIAAARLKYDALTWAARKMNRDAYDDRAGVQINVDASQQFLAAVSSPRAVPLPRRAEVVIERPPEQLPEKTTAQKIDAEQKRDAAIRRREGLLLQMGENLGSPYTIPEAHKEAVRQIHEAQPPAVNETVPGFKYVQPVPDSPDD